jgi:hypothetical protein
MGQAGGKKVGMASTEPNRVNGRLDHLIASGLVFLPATMLTYFVAATASIVIILLTKPEPDPIFFALEGAIAVALHIAILTWWIPVLLGVSLFSTLLAFKKTRSPCWCASAMATGIAVTFILVELLLNPGFDIAIGFWVWLIVGSFGGVIVSRFGYVPE